jgi:hypothetical protein
MPVFSRTVGLLAALLLSGCTNDIPPNLCDLDGDGHEGFACDGADCDDDDATTFPGADEQCDDLDHNCDGWVHQDAVDGILIFEDEDGDGYGDPLTEHIACQAGWPQTSEGGDCDDTDPTINPETIWYADTDSDGFGDPNNTLVACEQPDGFVANNQDGDDTDPNTAGCWVDITVGRNHSCAVKTDGSVTCWGSDADGQSTPPTGSNFVQISAGYRNTCALDGTTKQVSCWGSNTYGESSPPAASFRSVSCGLSACCGILDSNIDNVTCWGQDTEGQSSPPAGDFSAVSAGGGRHVCGILSSGELDCWGGADPFQGAGQSPTDFPSGSFSDLNSGHYFSCAVHTDGTGECWGTNAYGQADAPVGDWLTIRAGTVHSCGVEVGGEVSCWGSDSYDRTNSPPELMNTIDVNQLHSCGIGVDGIVRCWGYNDNGQLDAPPCQ